MKYFNNQKNSFLNSEIFYLKEVSKRMQGHSVKGLGL